ncbi:MAG: hypothetical protein HOP19_19865 [Acidobacteria bacterium]|nr:hypothetical protein [Acidobacteriota bacterium]
MKRMGLNLMALALFVCGLLMTTTATAKDQKLMSKNKQKTIVLMEDTMLNDQLLKRGTYRVKLNAMNSQVIVTDDDGEVVATAKANVTLGERKAEYNSFSADQTPKGRVITGLTFAGDRRVIIFESTMNGGNNAADGQGQQ